MSSLARAATRAAGVAVFVMATFGGADHVGHAAPPAPDDAPRLTLESQSFFLDGTVDLDLQLRLTDSGLTLDTATTSTLLPGIPTVAEGPTVIVYSYPAVTDPADVADPPKTEPIGSVEWPLSEVATQADDGSIDLDLLISPGTKADGQGISMQPLHIETVGLYPIEVRIVDRTTIASSATFVNRTGRETAPEDQLAAAIVVGIDDIGPAPSEAARAAARAELEDLIELADSTDLPLTVILPPSVVENLLDRDRALDTQVAQALVGQTLLAGPAFAIEPDAALGASISDQFRQTWAVGVQQLKSRYPQTTVDTSTMVIDAPTSVDGIGLLRDVGMRFAIIPNSIYTSADGQIGGYTDPGLLFAIRSPESQTTPAAVGSPALDLLDAEAASDVNPEMTPTERAVVLLAYLSAQQSSTSTSGRSAFLMTPELGVPDAAVIASIDALSTVEVAPDEGDAVEPARTMVFGSASQIAQRTEPHLVNGQPVMLSWPVSPTPVIASRLEHVQAAETVIRQSLSMLPPDDERREDWVWRVRSALSTTLTDGQAGSRIEDSLAQAERLRSSVPPPEPFEFTLTGSDTTLRFQLTNTAETALDVVFVMTSDRLIAPRETAVHLEPSTVTDIPIEVSARSNGSATVRVQVVTPDGLALFAPVEMNGRATTFGGTGQLLTVGALLVLMSWWFSFLRRRRQAAEPGRPVDDNDQAGDSISQPRREETPHG